MTHNPKHRSRSHSILRMLADRWGVSSKSFVHLGSVVACMMATASCSDNQVTDFKRPDIDTLYWSLRNDISATTIALHGTQQIVATPRTASGEPIANLMPTYQSTDVTKVTVDSNGLITAVAVTPGVSVIASLTAQGVTYADTTLVVVTPTSAVLGSVKLLSPGGNRLGASESLMLMSEVRDTANGLLSGLALSIRPLESGKVNLYPIGGMLMLYGQSLGKVKVVASTTSYGVSKADTMGFIVGFPMVGSVTLRQNFPDTLTRFSLETIPIGVNGTVTWANYTANVANVTFENDIEHIEGGNIDLLSSFGGSATRKFLAPGTYTYRNTLNGARGKIIVHTQSDD